MLKKEMGMNCCNANGECNQDHGCPVRVASVGYRYPKHPERLLDEAPYTFERVIEWFCWVILVGVLGLMVVLPCVYLLLRA